MIDPVGGNAAALLVREVDDSRDSGGGCNGGVPRDLPAQRDAACSRSVDRSGLMAMAASRCYIHPLVSSPLSRRGLASALTGRVFNQMTNSCSADIARAIELSEQDLAISPSSSLAHFAKA